MGHGLKDTNGIHGGEVVFDNLYTKHHNSGPQDTVGMFSPMWRDLDLAPSPSYRHYRIVSTILMAPTWP